jgi:hypothetical protein
MGQTNEEQEELDQQQKREAILQVIAETKDYSQLVEAYVGQRDEKEELKRKYTEDANKITEIMDAIEGRILALLQESGQESAKTKFGTAYKSPKSSVKIADWNVFINYVKKNDAFDLLTKNVSKDAVISRIECTQEIVPGVNIIRFETVGIRRS